MSDNQRLTDLEIRLAYLEDTLTTLDGVIARQSDEIARLEQTTRALFKRLANLDEQLASLGPDQGDEPPPPHY